MLIKSFQLFMISLVEEPVDEKCYVEIEHE